MRTWVRVEPISGHARLARVFVVVGAAFAVLVVPSVLFGEWQGHSRTASLMLGVLAAAFLCSWTAVAWRMSSVGVYLSAGHVHVRSFTSTRTIPWISVTRIVSRREDAYLTEDDAPNSLSTCRLRLVLDDDEEVVLPVQRWLDGQHRGPNKVVAKFLVLSPAGYERVKFILRTEWKRALAAASGRTDLDEG